MMELPAADNDERKFTVRAYVDTQVRFKTLMVVYTNDSFWVENTMHIMEQLISFDKYKVVGFDLPYTGGHVGLDRKVSVAQLCVVRYVIVYHYCMSTRTCERFAKFINSPDYLFGTMDTTNNEKVLKNIGLSCQNLVGIQCEYKILGR
ncbi:hypothetical protein D1007_55953 [Hordeum vulgare]|nr:hypothetical protein D1007_55953 [Hordeum vulgare]